MFTVWPDRIQPACKITKSDVVYNMDAYWMGRGTVYFGA